MLGTDGGRTSNRVLRTARKKSFQELCNEVERMLGLASDVISDTREVS
jgi:hypothetical protein